MRLADHTSENYQFPRRTYGVLMNPLPEPGKYESEGKIGQRSKIVVFAFTSLMLSLNKTRYLFLSETETKLLTNEKIFKKKTARNSG